jgi:hypothetical protein
VGESLYSRYDFRNFIACDPRAHRAAGRTRLAA